MVVRSEKCIFSGRKMYPSHGRFYVPCTSVNSTRPIFHLESKKARSLFERRIRPKQVRWTALYRKLHKKDIKKKQKDKDFYPKKLKCKVDLSYMSVAQLKAKKMECLKEREKKKKVVKKTKKKKLTKEQKRERKERRKQMGKKMVQKNVFQNKKR